jgi:hypothetical protein
VVSHAVVVRVTVEMRVVRVVVRVCVRVCGIVVDMADVTEAVIVVDMTDCVIVVVVDVSVADMTVVGDVIVVDMTVDVADMTVAVRVEVLVPVARLETTTRASLSCDAALAGSRERIQRVCVKPLSGVHFLMSASLMSRSWHASWPL